MAKKITKSLKVLIIEDSEQDTTLLIKELIRGGFTPVYKHIATESELELALNAENWDAVISGFTMANFSSLDALKLLRNKGFDLPFIIVSEEVQETAIVNSIKAGVNDYIAKGNLKRLVPVIKRELHDVQVRREHLQNEAELSAREKESQRSHIRHLNILTRFSQALGDAKDFESLLKKAIDNFIKTLRFSSGAIFLRDVTTGEFHLGASRVVSLEFAEILNKMFVLANEDCNTKNIKRRVFLRHFLDRTLVTDTRKLGFLLVRDQFVVSIPLKSSGKTIAMVMIASGSRKTLSREEKQLLNTISIQTAIAIENALLIQKMSQLSMTDELTRLYNRRHFYKVMEIELERARRYNKSLSLAFIDIDKFKDYNDKFGHSGGDGVLQSLAVIMNSFLRKTDTSFRYGGDEFAVIMPDTNSGRAKDVIERIRLKWFHMPKTESLGLENPIGFSAGIAEFPKNAKTLDNLVFLADAALYCSKRSGGYKSTLVSEMGEISTDMLATLSVEQIYALSATVDAKEALGYGHSIRVANIAEKIGQSIGLSSSELADIRGASLLHDIGKIGISDEILNKSDHLNSLEWELVKKHSIEGAKIVSQIKKISNLAPVIHHHHEWYDGTGYPDGLKGKAIPLGSRILSIADAYDTMVTKRSYGKVKSPDEALIELQRFSGIQFDPEIIKVVAKALS